MLKECTSENGYKFSEEDKKPSQLPTFKSWKWLKNESKRNFKKVKETFKLLPEKVAPEVFLGKIDKNITSLCFNFKSDLLFYVQPWGYNLNPLIYNLNPRPLIYNRNPRTTLIH